MVRGRAYRSRQASQMPLGAAGHIACNLHSQAPTLIILVAITLDVSKVPRELNLPFFGYGRLSRV